MVYSAQQPWSEARPGPEAGKECPEYNNIISYLSPLSIVVVYSHNSEARPPEAT